MKPNLPGAYARFAGWRLFALFGSVGAEQVSADALAALAGLAPANAQRPAGLSHVGIWPDDLNATILELRQRGVKVDDPRITSSKSSITNVTDPNGVRLELLNILPDSLQTRAIDSWK